MNKKFGTFKGVFVPSTEAILGTVLFLLMPLLTADVGFSVMLVIILLAHSVTLSTAFSLSDCATNLNKIAGGGMYALSKQSLGNAFGGSIGVQLYLAQAASVGFYCIGFAEPLQPLLAPFLDFIPAFTDFSPEGILLQKQILASAFFILFFLIVMAGADFTLKIQSVILVVLFLSIAAIFASPFLGIDFDGSRVFSGELNLKGNRPLTLGIFFMVFTQFFPAVTGISTGVGMSGDLKDPKKSIVRGTFSSILVTMVVYIFIALVYSLMNKDVLIHGYDGNNPVGVLLTELLGLGKSFPANIPGLLVLLGVLFATCSSALSVFMTGPRTLQFLAKDGILPEKLDFLKNDFVPGGNEPRYAILVTFFLGGSIIWMGSINLAATVVGILFLAVYGWMNGAAFLERFSRNPAFRPTFKGHWGISLYGFLSCLAAICLFNWFMGIAIFVMQYVLFQIIKKYRNNGKLEGVWWGFLFRLISSGLDSLRHIVQGTRNWRPMLTAFTFNENAMAVKSILKLSSDIASYQGLVNINLLSDGQVANNSDLTGEIHLPVKTIISNDYNQSILALLQGSSLCGIDTNTVLMEFNPKVDNVRIIKMILELEKNILLLTNADKLKQGGKLDIWWRGEKNGNLMVLLAFIMNRYYKDEKKEFYQIRILRKLGEGKNEKDAFDEMDNLLKKARLDGEIKIIPFDGEGFLTTLNNHSRNADLIMMGIPGNYTEKTENRFFKLNDFFFKKEIQQYESLPPLLFVRSMKRMKLIED